MLLDLLFPRRCPICEEIIKKKNKYICDKCKDKITYNVEPVCKKCGKSITTFEKEYCRACCTKNYYFDMGVSVFIHKADIKKSIYRFKYSNKREYKDFYINELLKKHIRTIKYWDADVIIPVPLHKNKKIKRGFNQAEILAKELGKRLNIEVNKELLVRDINTSPQKELSLDKRKKNLEKAFKLTYGIVQYKKIILVDDIYTTGNTMNFCAKELKKAGVKKVYFVTLSSGDSI